MSQETQPAPCAGSDAGALASQSHIPAKPHSPAKGSGPVTAAEADNDSPVRFEDLSLRDEVLQSVTEAGYETPTEIQARIIPQMLSGRDVLAQSQTGTGKTAAFALPILSRIDTDRSRPQVLVLTPTRELAMQVAASFEGYASRLPGVRIAAVYGGQDYGPQIRQLRRGVPVVVGTPGRVIDHIKRGTLDLSGIDTLVLDEADEMLNMGFLDDVRFVLEHSPNDRRIALFSATIPPPIRQIAQRYLDDPARITVQRKTMTVETIRQRAVIVAPREKILALTRFLEVEETDGVIVFTKTREATTTVADQLVRHGLSAVALNGDMPQKARERTIGQLKAGRLDILVATDVAARGLDVQRISHVFNYDLPHGTESYVHRIGRTGRAGRNGEAIIFLTRSQRGKLRAIERLTKQPIRIVEPPSADEINAIRIMRFRRQISETAASEELGFYQELIQQHVEETGQPWETVAAALAQMTQQGRSFFVSDRPSRKSAPHSERSVRPSDRDPQDTRPNRKPRDQGPPEPGKTRYRIAVGRRDGVKAGNIVGAVANEGGIAGEFIGPIRINQSYSTVDLPDDVPQEILETLKRTRIVGKRMRLSVSTDHGENPTETRNRHVRKKPRHASRFGGKRKPKPRRRRDT